MRFRNRIQPLALALAVASSMAIMAMGTAVASPGHGGGEARGSGFAFGSPADASKADRTIHVAANDQMTFSPERMQLQAGETVRFVVENVGSMEHSFTLATPAGQDEHEQQMQGMAPEKMAGHMRQEPNGIVVQPGETKTLTWRFARGGPVQFACHIPGHYPAGMKGRIAVK